VANVWDAMKKHQAEQAVSPAAAPAPSAPAQDLAPARGSSAPPSAPAPGTPWTSIAATSLNGYAPSLVVHHDRGGTIAEEYRAMRTNLLAQYPDERFCVLVTSAEAGEGKTVTCLNLALVLAERPDHRTVIVDCDLRKHRVATMLGINNVPGLAEVISGKARLEQVIRDTKYRSLFVVPAGQAAPGEVGELLGRPDIDDVVNDLRRQYDHVLFDAPPMTLPDAGMLGRTTREAVLVVRMDKTHRESVDRAIGLLHAANVKPVGIILTYRRYPIPNYLYRYS